MDPASHKLTIGDGSGPAGYSSWDGSRGINHPVEITNGETTHDRCMADGMGSRCWIRLINRDPDYYMSNAFILPYGCAACSVGLGGNYQIDNADVQVTSEWPPVVPYPGMMDGLTLVGAGGPVPVNISGFTYASDRHVDISPIAPFNPYNAPLIDVPNDSNAMPEWMIAPQGAVAKMWDFGGSSAAPFGFFVALKATWELMNPLGPDGLQGTADDDDRFDFQHFSTAYLVLTDLWTDPAEPAALQVYRPGAVQRSHRLAGYGASQPAVATIDYTGGQKYFAVNIGVEAADRLETQNHGYHISGVRSDPSYQFEYYNSFSFLLTFDPNFIREISVGDDAAHTFRGGSSIYYQLAQSSCTTIADCAPPAATATTVTSFQEDLIIDPAQTEHAVAGRGGYIQVRIANPLQDFRNWDYFRGTDTYSWFDGTNMNPVTGFAARNFPRNFNSRGFMKIRCNTVSGSPANNSACVQQDGADPDVENWAAVIYFMINPAVVSKGLVGLGTEIKVDTCGDFTQYPFFRSNGTYANGSATGNQANLGGWGAASDDLGNFEVYEMIDGVSTMIIGGASNLEQPNTRIKHKGPYRFGTFQAWNVAVVIQ